MDIIRALDEVGGVSTRSYLVSAASRRAVDRALRSGQIVALARDRYALPSVDQAIARAYGLSGVLCLASATIFHGWGVEQVPERPQVAVAKGRRISAERRAGTHLHRFVLGPDDITDGIVTSKEATLRHCLRMLPFDEALAIADSACRSDDGQRLRRVAVTSRGPGSARIRELASLARRDAANPFESVLRAIALQVPGLHVEPQVLITSVTPWVRPDLVDRELRIVIEADSFEWHGHRAALAADARRYNRLVVDGWTVLRFSWEDVMLQPDSIRDVLTRAAIVCEHTERRPGLRPAA